MPIRNPAGANMSDVITILKAVEPPEKQSMTKSPAGSVTISVRKMRPFVTTSFFSDPDLPPEMKIEWEYIAPKPLASSMVKRQTVRLYAG